MDTLWRYISLYICILLKGHEYFVCFLLQKLLYSLLRWFSFTDLTESIITKLHHLCIKLKNTEKYAQLYSLICRSDSVSNVNCALNTVFNCILFCFIIEEGKNIKNVCAESSQFQSDLLDKAILRHVQGWEGNTCVFVKIKNAFVSCGSVIS